MFIQRYFACIPMAVFAVLMTTIILVGLVLCHCVSYDFASMIVVGATAAVEIGFVVYILFDVKMRRRNKLG